MRRGLFVVLAGCVVALAVWRLVSAQGPGAAEVRRVSGLVFARPGGQELRLDLALPVEGPGPFPAVLCLHGGGWVSGERQQMKQTIEVLARRGFVAAAADYRLAPKHRFPAQVEDAKSAVRWLRAHAGEYQVDPDRIGVMGLAAGGHLACLLGVTAPGDGLEGTQNAGQSSKVQAVASLSGPTDLLALKGVKAAVENNLVPLLGARPEEKPEVYQAASPVHFAPHNPPPFLLIHGGADPIVPVQQAHDFADRLNKAGGKARVQVLQGEGHTWSGLQLLKGIDVMLTFLDENLKK
jgi:acetyl esterase/lipase